MRVIIVRVKHLKEEFSKDLSNEQKNASPLLGEGWKVEGYENRQGGCVKGIY